MAGQGWQATEPRSVLIPNGLSAMGFGVPAAIAARLTRPDRPVLALVGDGGFAMAATEMRIAASLGLPVTVVVFADNSLNRIELRQQRSATRPPPPGWTGWTWSPWPRRPAATASGWTPRPPWRRPWLAWPPGPAPLIVEARIDPTQYEAQF